MLIAAHLENCIYALCEWNDLSEVHEMTPHLFIVQEHATAAFPDVELVSNWSATATGERPLLCKVEHVLVQEAGQLEDSISVIPVGFLRSLSLIKRTSKHQ